MHHVYATVSYRGLPGNVLQDSAGPVDLTSVTYTVYRLPPIIGLLAGSVKLYTACAYSSLTPLYTGAVRTRWGVFSIKATQLYCMCLSFSVEKHKCFVANEGACTVHSVCSLCVIIQHKQLAQAHFNLHVRL